MSHIQNNRYAETTFEPVDSIERQREAFEHQLSDFIMAEMFESVATGRDEEEFDARVKNCRIFFSNLLSLLTSEACGLTLNDFNIITVRPKTSESLQEKIDRYSMLGIKRDEIFDMVGARIVVKNEEVERKILELVSDFFPVMQDKIIGNGLSHKGIRLVEKEKTGYRAVHINLAEMPSFFKPVTYEIQIITKDVWVNMLKTIEDPDNAFTYK